MRRWYLLLVICLLAACKPYYIVSDFNARTAAHKTIAVLPFETVFLGVKPALFTSEDMDKIRKTESKAFMISLVNDLRRQGLRVQVQEQATTEKILQDNNIAVDSAYMTEPSKLAAMLGVDAVVKGRVEKYVLMGDLRSYGIDVGTKVISVLGKTKVGEVLPDFAEANKIKSNYALLDKDGTSLWSMNYETEVTWTSASREIIDKVNSRAANKFPYRK